MMKKALWVALGLILLGSGLFLWAMTALGWDFFKLSTVTYETTTHVMKESFFDLSIDSRTTDVEILPSDDGVCRVVCHEIATCIHTVEVIDGVLTVKQDKSKQPQFIGIDFDAPKISIYLPEGEYAAVEVQVSTGDVAIKSVSAQVLDIRVSTGDIALTDVVCGRFFSDGRTGDVLLKNMIADEISITRNTGDVRFEKSDAASIEVKTNTGSVTGSLLTDKVFSVETRTGDIDLPNTSTGGTCQIETGTGDIRLTIAG